jgi:predicted DNA-binding transcriptional regulator AlpA
MRITTTKPPSKERSEGKKVKEWKPHKWRATKVVPGPVLRRPQAMSYCGLGDTMFDELVRDDASFPKPIKISDKGRTVAWLRSELDQWLELRKAKRDADLKKKAREVV